MLTLPSARLGTWDARLATWLLALAMTALHAAGQPAWTARILLGVTVAELITVVPTVVLSLAFALAGCMMAVLKRRNTLLQPRINTAQVVCKREVIARTKESVVYQDT